MSSLLGSAVKAEKQAELQEALDVERGCWDSQNAFGISAEVSRRWREKGFRKDFEGDVHHLARKQECLGSEQVRGNIGQPSVAPESAREARKWNRQVPSTRAARPRGCAGLSRAWS